MSNERKPLLNMYKTALETKFQGGSEWIDGAKVGKINIPLGMIWQDKDFSLAEARRLREEAKYFGSAAIRGVVEDPNAVLSFEPLNDAGEAEDPKVFIRDLETGSLIPSPELTRKLYDRMAEIDAEERSELLDLGIVNPDWYYASSFFRQRTQEGVPGKERA